MYELLHLSESNFLAGCGIQSKQWRHVPTSPASAGRRRPGSFVPRAAGQTGTLSLAGSGLTKVVACKEIS